MKQILVIDDDPALLRQISALLSEEYEVTLANSGPQALQVSMKAKPDLILLDIEMPGMDGFELISRLRQNPGLSRIPVIFLTAIRDAATELRALEAGGRDFIPKPAEKSILLHRIGLHLRLSSCQAKAEEALTDLSDGFAAAVAELVESRDENSNVYAARSSTLVEILGRELVKNGFFADELALPELRLIVRAAPLHDIGKIAISDNILLKAGRLDDEEFAVMKRHAAIGGEILAQMYRRIPTQHYLHYASLIAASHHERWDGKGYPAGLSGEDIPLCGRIMAVADVYEALMNSRVYRSGMGHSEAYNIITEGKGAQFDPRIVDVFERIRDELAAQYHSMV